MSENTTLMFFPLSNKVNKEKKNRNNSDSTNSKIKTTQGSG